MKVIEKETPVGKLYINVENGKMALERNEEVIADNDKIMKIFNANRIPLKAEFEITEKCNFDCYYCFAKSLRNRADLGTSDMKKIIDLLEELGIVFIDITGGEPLARQDFLEIIKYINSKEFIVSIITNGSMLTDEIVEELEKGNISVIRLSLLAPTEESCDRLTGVKGSFKKTKLAVKRLKNSKLNFYVSSVITKANVKMCEEYRKLEEEIGMKISYELDVGPTFTGYDPVEKYGLTYDDIDYIKEFAGSNGYRNDREKTCDAGKSKFCINNQGKMLPCMKIRKAVGDLLEDSFIDIWNSDDMNKVIESQIQVNEKCLKCDKKAYCVSFCPAQARMYKDYKTRCKSANLINKLITV